MKTRARTVALAASVIALAGVSAPASAQGKVDYA
jgi:hypothetical protein